MGHPVAASGRLQQLEAAKLIQHGTMAFARNMLQSLTVLDRYMAARAVDQTGLVEHPCRQGNGGSGGAQHLTEEFLGERHPVGLHAIVAGQEPTSQALADRM